MKHASELAPSTEETHRGAIETHLVPFFGNRDLRAISRDDIREFIEDRFDAGRSASTIRNALSALRRVYSLHVEAGLLDANPASRCGELVERIGRRYSDGVREIDAWTREEAETLLATAREHEPYLYPVLLTAFCTGMRRSELLGLPWTSVRRDSIRVVRALVRGKLKSPKSGKPHSVPLSPEVRELLKEQRRTRKRREGAWSDPKFVFTSPSGMRWDANNFSKVWRRLLRRCVVDGGQSLVRPLTFHCCRHTFASWALEAGHSVVWVQHALGHASPDTTLRTYSHFVPREGEEMGFLGLGADHGQSMDSHGHDRHTKNLESVK